MARRTLPLHVGWSIAAAAMFLAVVSSAGCRKIRRYDGTCTENAHCLDFQTCNAGVCVRKGIEGTKPPKPVPPSQAKLRKTVPDEWNPDRERPEPSAPGEEARAPGQNQHNPDKPAEAEPAVPAPPPRPEFRAPPRPRGRAAARFRIDA